MGTATMVFLVMPLPLHVTGMRMEEIGVTTTRFSVKVVAAAGVSHQIRCQPRHQLLLQRHLRGDRIIATSVAHVLRQYGTRGLDLGIRGTRVRIELIGCGPHRDTPNRKPVIMWQLNFRVRMASRVVLVTAIVNRPAMCLFSIVDFVVVVEAAPLKV